jgi:peptidoglycan/LPS O-acetylase OafA/YrhL
MPAARRPARSLRLENSYDFVRFCAASAVLFSHHYHLAGFPEPVVPGYGEDFGQLGVQVFFALSGFLICRSLQASADWRRFLAARVTRILPNLVFVLVATSLTTFLWYRNFGHAPDHIVYIANNLAMLVLPLIQTIPGVFADRAVSTMNEPLWTLPHEIWLYIALFAIFAAAGKRAGIVVVLATLVFGVMWALDPLKERWIGPLEAYELFRLGSFFLCGAVIAVFWPWLKRHALALGIAGLAGTFAFVNVLPQLPLLQAMSLAACVIGLGQSKLMAWFSRGGDASYGIYVFAWPMQQFCLLLIAPFWPSFVAAFVLTTALGYATWHLFEKHAIARRDRLAAWLHFGEKPRRTALRKRTSRRISRVNAR